MGVKSVSKKRANKLVKKGKAVISTSETGEKVVSKIKRKARKNKWYSSKDIGRTKTIKGQPKPKLKVCTSHTENKIPSCF